MVVTFKTDNVKIYIAGAGSGKTTALNEELSVVLGQYRPEEIACTTFTRKGVQTMVERALLTNPNLVPENLMYFQTLHKMCFHESGLKRKNIIEVSDLRRFNQLLGFKLSLSTAFNTQTEDDKMLQRYDALRSSTKTGIFIHAMYDEDRYYRLVNAYETFKKENDLVDFYDCLLRYKEVGKPLPVAAFFLDEAQDVTPLQWEVIQIASANAELVRVAGDPAQSIFSYQGSVPQMLIDMTKRYDTIALNTTYRLPRKICAVADSIISLMQEKIPREHAAAKDMEGGVTHLAEREMLTRIIKKDYKKTKYKENRWYLLFRCNQHIQEVADVLEMLTIPYHTAKGFCFAARELAKLKRFFNYRKAGFGSDEAKAAFAQQYGIKDFNASFTESSLIGGERRYIYEDYINEYGLDELCEMAAASPWCLLTTTHKVKGGEADNVAVFLDATKLVAESMLVDLDAELRVWYVACTRAREQLYIVDAYSKHNLTQLWEMTQEMMT